MSLSPQQMMALGFDPSLILQAQGYEPDAWQRDLLLNPSKRHLVMCSRGAGKSRTVSALALHTALFQPGSLTLLVARAQRQSLELFRYVKEGYSALKRPIETTKENETTIEFANKSRIIALPGKEGSIRAYQGVSLLVLDEASRVPDDLYYSCRPMLGTSKGKMVAMTTPFGRRGWFHKEWTHGGDTFARTLIPWSSCPRLTPEFIEGERASLGDAWVAQEYECKFTSMEGLVYPEFHKCIWDVLGMSRGRLIGGIDFGYRNPFAAVWGTYDRESDTIRLVGERYLRETAMSEHVRALKALGDYYWYADPAGANERAEMRAADLRVLRGNNDIRLGIMAVAARIRTGRLRVSRTGCPNLIAEAQLYRYPGAGDGDLVQNKETPVDRDNHALAALRYLVSRIDERFLAKLRGKSEETIEEATAEKIEKKREAIRSIFGADVWTNEDLWS